MARGKKTARNGNKKQEDSDSYLRSFTRRGEESGWFADPGLAGLVTSQVEDTTLINQRRAQFVHTAIDLFSRNGYHPTTVKQIADAAKVSPGLIYQYVTDKEEVLFLALQLIVHTNKQVIPAAIASLSDPVERFVAAFDAYCRVFDANRTACLLTYRETKSLRADRRDAIKNMEVETNELLAHCVRECIKKGYFREINVEVFVYQTVMAAHTWALKYWRLRKVVSLDEYISSTTDMLMNAVLTRQGWTRYLDHVRSVKKLADEQKKEIRKVVANPAPSVEATLRPPRTRKSAKA